MLAEEGDEMREATTGAAGLQRYEAAPTDGVMTDLRMPGMEGREVLEALRRLLPTPALLAIAGDGEALTQARRYPPIYVCAVVPPGVSPGHLRPTPAPSASASRP